MKFARILLLLGTLLLAGAVAVSFAACNNTNQPSDETTTEADTTSGETTAEETTAEETTAEETTAEETTEEETTVSVVDEIGLNAKAEDLNVIMRDVFSGTTSMKETVMFIDKGDVKSLLFPIESIVTVTSYDGKTTYEEGKDYVIEDGKLKVTENSSIRCITSAVYYNYAGSLIHKNGKPLFWGESQMKQWQVCVTYTHEDNWDGYLQDARLDVYKDFVKKLVDGEDVTVFFYGDSITWGACSTYAEGVQPMQGAYPMLFVEALADLFDYKVVYADTGIVEPYVCHPVPTADYVAGDRGTITYVNTAIGGWTSSDAVKNFDRFVAEQVEKFGCDLLVLGYGMNDGMYSTGLTKKNLNTVMDSVWALNPDAAVMLVATMTPHSGTNWDYRPIQQQEGVFLEMAEGHRQEGKAVAVACMNSVSKEVQKHKTFNDYAGNNINHPNDWFYRVYAQTLLQTLIGYENLK